MTKSQKAEFTIELKDSLKPLIIMLSQEQAEKAVRPLRSNLEDYKSKADEHRELIV